MFIGYIYTRNQCGFKCEEELKQMNDFIEYENFIILFSKKFLIGFYILTLTQITPAIAKSPLTGVEGFKPGLGISRPARPISKNPQLNNPALGGASQNTGKSVSVNKVPRAPSGFRTPHKPVNQGFGATGLAGSGSGSNGSGDPGDDSNPKNSGLNRTSSDQCKNQTFPNSDKKQKKKKKNITEEQVLQVYQDFMARMHKKGYEIKISEKRFLALSRNPQTGKFDEKSIIETEGCLELEAMGKINNLKRPKNSKVDLDFVAERDGKIIFIDHKKMIDFESLVEKGIDVSRYPNHETVAFNMGRDSIYQKRRFIGMDQGPTSIEEVLHLYNFENIKDRREIPILIQAVINGAEYAGYTDTDGIIFLNYQ